MKIFLFLILPDSPNLYLKEFLVLVFNQFYGIRIYKLSKKEKYLFNKKLKQNFLF